MKIKRLFLIITIFLMLTLLASGIFLYAQIAIISFVLRGYEISSTPHFIILHKPENRQDIPIVKNAAERTYSIVGQAFNFCPKKKVVIVMFPDSTGLQRKFNWYADESAQAAYYRGVIYLQSPGHLLEKTRNPRMAFFQNGPLIHEYTHLVVDGLTSGNYTQWFTEGVAQFVERKITGYTLHKDFDIDMKLDYTYEEMFNSFDRLNDVPRAYIKALEMVDLLAKNGGITQIKDILRRLRSGESANAIFLETMTNMDSEGKMSADIEY